MPQEKKHQVPHLIALTGKKRHGKNATAKAIYEVLNGTLFGAFADALRLTCSRAFPMMNFTDDALKEVPCGFYNNNPGFGGITPRKVLQDIGSAARALDRDVWVKALFCCPPGTGSYNAAKALDRVFVITDLRYLNEAAAVKERGGVIWRVVRPDIGESGDMHSSETEQDQITADAVIFNDHDLNYLKTVVSRLLMPPAAS